MTEKDRVIEGKKERQRTMDKLSIKSARAYTYDKEKGGGSGCLSNAKTAREEAQRELDR
jgi:hypothetical protein